MPLPDEPLRGELPRGDNLPTFQAVQLEFAAHIRHPDRNPRPADVPEARMRVYNELFYNNIESFISKTFPVMRSIFDDDAWHGMVRDFVHRHTSRSPYFLEIPEEFLGYLQNERTDDAESVSDPPFLIELCHYEWVELALDVAGDVDLPPPGGSHDLLREVPLISPHAWSLQYRYPVHKIGPDNQPAAPPTDETFLIVYRNRQDRVKFMESNIVTARLLQLLVDGRTGAEALGLIADELDTPHDAVLEKGHLTLKRLQDCDIIVGVVT